MAHTLSYEYPLNERMRLFLRLEYLFLQAQHFCEKASPWESHVGLSTLTQILVLLERPDLKGELLKEIERQQKQFKRWQALPEVDNTKLSHIFKTLNEHANTLQNAPPKFGHPLKDNEIINAMRHRQAVPGGCCSFDAPLYHYWLHHDAAQRQQELLAWLKTLYPVYSIIRCLLGLVREIKTTANHTAENGFFQYPLDPTQTDYQIIKITCESTAFPEVSASRHCINIRFLKGSATQKPETLKINIPFELRLS